MDVELMEINRLGLPKQDHGRTKETLLQKYILM
jgi:hypothetical protein